MAKATKRRVRNTDKALSYTQWAIKYPWHVSGTMDGKYPRTASGKCACKCVYCRQRGVHGATRVAHLKS